VQYEEDLEKTERTINDKIDEGVKNKKTLDETTKKGQDLGCKGF
jgi:hypothetical protein